MSDTSVEGVSECPQPVGFHIEAHKQNNRLQVITLSEQVTIQFADRAFGWGLQAVEYKPFLRFALANALDQLCEHSLSPCLNAIMADRNRAAFLLQYQGDAIGKDEQEVGDFHVLLSTAVSHLVGVPNFDAMYGKYYARFTVKNDDNSDSYLRKAHRRMELHNDGTYVDERTDFVLMMKMAEQHMEGGESLLLHLDDWQALDRFYQHPLAKQPIRWGSPPSKNVGYKIEHPVFFEEDQNGQPHMLYIDQFAEPENMQQGLYLYEMGESIEGEQNCFAVRLPVGAMLVIQNHCWLHGRDRFVAHPELSRELLRQRGHFSQS